MFHSVQRIRIDISTKSHMIPHRMDAQSGLRITCTRFMLDYPLHCRAGDLGRRDLVLVSLRIYIFSAQFGVQTYLPDSNLKHLKRHHYYLKFEKMAKKQLIVIDSIALYLMSIIIKRQLICYMQLRKVI